MPITYNGFNSQINGGYEGTTPMPAHSVGDLLVLHTGSLGRATQPTKPAAGGAVPNWTLIPSTVATPGNAQRSSIYYTYATSSAVQSGYWTNCQFLSCWSFSGTKTSSPFGSGSVGSGYTVANLLYRSPNISLDSPGSSFIIGGIWRTGSGAVGAVSAGWTTVYSGDTYRNFYNKNSSANGDGFTASAENGYNGSEYCAFQLEILAPPSSGPSSGFFTMF